MIALLAIIHILYITYTQSRPWLFLTLFVEYISGVFTVDMVDEIVGDLSHFVWSTDPNAPTSMDTSLNVTLL